MHLSSQSCTKAAGLMDYSGYLYIGQAKTAINDAIDTYRTQTCIEFIPRTNEADYVRFFRGSG